MRLNDADKGMHLIVVCNANVTGGNTNINEKGESGWIYYGK